jgi:FtsP/CotA-like multicopper oxidase with cupredoxin domain
VVAVAVVVVAIAFVALRPDDSSKKADDPAAKAGETTSTKEPTATAPSAPAPPQEVTIKGGKPVGGIKSIKVQKGDVVRLQVTTDEPTDQLHLHGYDIEKTAAKGKPANFRFKATIEGVFELESHTAEHAGREPLLARLVVEPS